MRTKMTVFQVVFRKFYFRASIFYTGIDNLYHCFMIRFFIIRFSMSTIYSISFLNMSRDIFLNFFPDPLNCQKVVSPENKVKWSRDRHANAVLGEFYGFSGPPTHNYTLTDYDSR